MFKKVLLKTVLHVFLLKSKLLFLVSKNSELKAKFLVKQNSGAHYSLAHLKFTGKAEAKLSLKEKARLQIRFMEDIFPTTDYHFLGFS